MGDLKHFSQQVPAFSAERRVNMDGAVVARGLVELKAIQLREILAEVRNPRLSAAAGRVRIASWREAGWSNANQSSSLTAIAFCRQMSGSKSRTLCCASCLT
jgi:hypothetical protein